MSKRSPFYKDKLEIKLKEDLNVFLRGGVGDSRLNFVSVTKVTLSKDLAYASVYWDTYDSSKKAQIEEAFDDNKGKLRSKLSQALKVRHTPTLNFIYDSQYESELAITKILDEAKKAAPEDNSHLDSEEDS